MHDWDGGSGVCLEQPPCSIEAEWVIILWLCLAGEMSIGF